MVDLRGAVAGVREGLQGRLFLGSQDGFDLDRFSGGAPFTPAALSRWRRTLQRRGRNFAARGIPYIFFIVPDAPSVYPEDLPPEYRGNFVPPGQIFLDAMGDIEGVTFVYPLTDLRTAKGGLEIYKKKDSHWSVLGSYVGYRSLVRVMARCVDCVPVRAEALRFDFRKAYGDLGSQTLPEQVEEIPSVRIAGPEITHIKQFDGVGRQTATEAASPTDTGACRALFFRDSFMTDLAPYIVRTFGHTLTVGTTTRVLMDVCDDWKADVVVSEVAERRLGFYESDHQLESFKTLYCEGPDASISKRLLHARISLADEPAAALRLIGTDPEPYLVSPGYAFSASIIHEANGLPDSAQLLARHALEYCPTEGSFLALAARTALACQDFDTACQLSKRAIEHAGYNGYFHELHAYCLMHALDNEAALQAAEDALTHVQDNSNLYYWASVLHAGLGNSTGAVARIDEALALDPDNPVYHAQRRKLSESQVLA